MHRRLWLLTGAAVAMLLLAASAAATTRHASTASRANLAAAPFAKSWANVPRSPAARKAKSVLVFGMEQDVAGFNTNDADETALWASITGIEPVIRGTYIIDNNGNYKLDLASKVSVTKKDFTITIRPDAFWNWGGKKLPVTNQDVAYTWKQFLDPNNNVASITGYDQIGSYTLKGTKTIVFHWRTSCPPGTVEKGTCGTGPFADYRDLFAGPLGIMPQKALAGLDFNKLWADCVCGNDGKPVSNGPFIVTNYTRGQGLTLKPNPFWYGAKPGLKEIDFKLITDTNSEIQAMRGGEVDAIYPSPQTALSQLIHQNGLTYSSISGFTQEHWDINTADPGNPLLRNQWMRQALTLAINRHSLIQALYGQISPGQKPLNNLEYELGPNASGANAHFAKWATAPGKAISILKAHCTGGPTKPTRNNSAIWSCNGQPASFNFYTTAGNQRRATSAAIFAQQLGAVGIKLNVNFEPANPNFFGTRLPAHNFDLAEYAWSGGPDPSGFDAIYTCGGGQNYKQYCNKQVDALIHAGDAELNPTKRTADYEKADAIMSNDIPVIPLYSPPNILVYKSAIKGMSSSNNPTLEGPTWNAELWHW
jgi:peptide/nickel transport system substrate-binding protein